MKKIIPFELRMFSSPLSKGTRRYRAEIVSTRTLGLDDVAEEIASSSKDVVVSKELVSYVLNTATKVIPERVSIDGNRRRLGDLVTFAPRITGSFGSVNDKSDASRNQLQLRAYSPTAMKLSLDGVDAKNVTGGIPAMIAQVVDETTRTKDVIIGKGTFDIGGSDLDLVEGRADEFVELVGLDGTSAATATVDYTQSNGTCVVASLPLVPAPGVYYVVVHTRSGLDTSYGVASVRHQVTLRA